MEGDGVKTLRETLISELGMGMSRDELINAVDRRNTVELSVKISSLDGRGVVEILREVDSASNEVECTCVVVGNISTEVENAFFEAGMNASIELKMASVDVKNAPTKVELMAGDDGVEDDVIVLAERVSSYDDIGMSLLLKDVCKVLLESMVLLDASIVDGGIKTDASTEVGIRIWKLSFGALIEVTCEYKSVVISGMTMFEEGTVNVEGLRERLVGWKILL